MIWMSKLYFLLFYATFILMPLLLYFREALSKGVYTDKTLRDRFFRVEKLAKQTSLIKEGEASLLMYLLSYVRSLIMVSPSTEQVRHYQVTAGLYL